MGKAEIRLSFNEHLSIKNITKDKEGHYIMIKESIQKEDITIVNIYAANIGTPEAPGGSDGVGDMGSIPGSGRSSEEGNGNPLQYSCLENPMDGGAWQATVDGVTKNRTD